ncbi:MAG: sn-glycerol-3-phosphate ABC transporter ATP-binding protein UgpC [Chloroflexi bacterium]|nr:sn-glycerol-3-phosphate ABC transporter ATP-binding protein UgpC [Chloroflexota bacterium]
MAGVTLDHISKKYGEVTAVNDLNIQIRDQEFLVLVGPSGCGKSTALRMIAGLEEITGGDLYIGDRRVNDVAPKDRDIAMVFQSYALYPHMSVYDNMAFGLKLRKRPKQEIERRVKEAAELLGLQNLLQRKPKQLSGGQRQRVALGRAIVREPQVFLMDEPLSNLDAKLRVETRAGLIKLHQRLLTTTVYVTHDQVEAMTMGHRIAVMREGVMQQLDTPQTLYDRPANLFVAGFIGTPAMNFFPGQLVAENNGQDVFVQTSGLKLKVPERLRGKLTQQSGRDIIFGVRPEHIHARSEVREAQPGQLATVNVSVIEPLGSEVFAYLATNGHEFIARMDASVQPRPGESIETVFDTDHLHVFDKETEQALS